jgi:hypothetical protein
MLPPSPPCNGVLLCPCLPADRFMVHHFFLPFFWLEPKETKVQGQPEGSARLSGQRLPMCSGLWLVAMLLCFTVDCRPLTMDRSALHPLLSKNILADFLNADCIVTGAAEVLIVIARNEAICLAEAVSIKIASVVLPRMMAVLSLRFLCVPCGECLCRCHQLLACPQFHQMAGFHQFMQVPSQLPQGYPMPHFIISGIGQCMVQQVADTGFPIQ